MIVLSLFDGMGCGRIALDRMGVTITKYYACEIDTHAIKVTKTKWPDIIHLGSVTNINVVEIGHIDLIIGGSPCQGFSFAGKQLAFDDPRSRLFFEFVRIVNEARAINPNVKFMLENVRMKKEHEDVISMYMGIQPININANLVSAQNRERLFWCNFYTRKQGLFGDTICAIPQPKDRGIYLRDILETDVPEKYYLSETALARIIRNWDNGFTNPKINPDKTGTINTKNNSGQLSIDGGTTLIIVDINGNPKPNQNKAGCFTAGGHSGGNHSDMDLIAEPICVAMRGRNPDNPNDRTPGAPTEQMFQANGVDKTNCLTSVAKDNLIAYTDIKLDDITPGQYIQALHMYRIRRLTPVEVCRLQGVPDQYFWHEGKQIVSDSQIYKMCGNGWNVDVITHILSFL